MKPDHLSRREFAAVSLAAGASAISGGRSYARNIARERENDMDINIFSKHLEWLDYAGMAETASRIGFDGIDLTVRPKGHVEPERVKDDLPRAIEAIHAAGLQAEMMTTRITDPRDPLTATVLETASELGFRHYRMGPIHYKKTGSIQEQLDELKPAFRDLAAMNEHYGIHGAYQNHCGSRNLGAAVWDIYELLRELDPEWIGCQFDIRHATVEGGTVWPVHFRIISPYIHTIIAKDFLWEKTAKDWKTRNCPLGEGMVDFPAYFKMVSEAGLPGPLSIHFEYDLGGANRGAEEITISPDRVISAMRRDLEFTRKLLNSR